MLSGFVNAVGPTGCRRLSTLALTHCWLARATPPVAGPNLLAVAAEEARHGLLTNDPHRGKCGRFASCADRHGADLIYFGRSLGDIRSHPLGRHAGIVVLRLTDQAAASVTRAISDHDGCSVQGAGTGDRRIFARRQPRA